MVCEGRQRPVRASPKSNRICRSTPSRRSRQRVVALASMSSTRASVAGQGLSDAGAQKGFSHAALSRRQCDHAAHNVILSCIYEPSLYFSMKNQFCQRSFKQIVTEIDCSHAAIGCCKPLPNLSAVQSASQPGAVWQPKTVFNAGRRETCGAFDLSFPAYLPLAGRGARSPDPASPLFLLAVPFALFGEPIRPIKTHDSRQRREYRRRCFAKSGWFFREARC